MQENIKHNIQVIPEDQIIHVEHGQTLLEALIAAGIFLRADCGGKRRCAKCRVKISGSEVAAVSPPENSEISFLGEKELQNGSRLACCAEVIGDVQVEIPATSRLSPEVAQKGPTILFDKLSKLKPASTAGAGQCGLAVDLGTTTLVAQLLDLQSGALLAIERAMNPQAVHGADVMSRLEHARTAAGRRRLVESIRSRIREMLAALTASAVAPEAPVESVVVAGNAAMHHLFCDLDPAPLSRAPFEPTEAGPRSFRPMGRSPPRLAGPGWYHQRP